jgi:hypothetical protein
MPPRSIIQSATTSFALKPRGADCAQMDIELWADIANIGWSWKRFLAVNYDPGKLSITETAFVTTIARRTLNFELGSMDKGKGPTKPTFGLVRSPPINGTHSDAAHNS